jgi:hypothetical protein
VVKFIDKTFDYSAWEKSEPTALDAWTYFSVAEVSKKATVQVKVDHDCRIRR